MTISYFLSNLGWYLFALPFAGTGLFFTSVIFDRIRYLFTEPKKYFSYEPGLRIFMVWLGLILLWIAYCMVT